MSRPTQHRLEPGPKSFCPRSWQRLGESHPLWPGLGEFPRRRSPRVRLEKGLVDPKLTRTDNTFTPKPVKGPFTTATCRTNNLFTPEVEKRGGTAFHPPVWSSPEQVARKGPSTQTLTRGPTHPRSYQGGVRAAVSQVTTLTTALVRRGVRLPSCLVESTTRLRPRTCPRLAFIGIFVAQMNLEGGRGVRSPRAAGVGLVPGHGPLTVTAVGAAHNGGNLAETELTTLTSHRRVPYPRRSHVAQPHVLLEQKRPFPGPIRTFVKWNHLP